MVELMNGILSRVIGENCTERYLVDYDFFDGECFKVILSKGLGFGIIGGSLLVKVPQIVKILSNKSAEGINLFSVLLDLFAITCHVSYSFVNGFPFTAWGDGTFLGMQTAAIAALILFYGGSLLKSILFVLLYVGACFVLMGGLTPIEYLWSMQALNIPVLVLGKLSQAWTNFQNKSTGQLSAATCFMLFAGSVARIFTSVQETGDFMMVLTYSVSTFANGVIVSQMLYYWNKPTKAKQGKNKQNKTSTKQSKSKSKKAD
ncbi:mannose-P-dolichol utilization defect 1 protein homolog [Hermetia illucens]|nr:mannose-P-dolichol utilization defect 1 protein homolog [Hermetia illucens]